MGIKQISVIVLIVIIALGAVGYTFITRPPAAPSQDINTGNGPSSSEGESVYRISQEQSRAQFTIDEMLRGKPFTAVGTTNQVSGDIVIKAAASGIQDIQIGTIRINARTFKTDSPQRDGAINHLILKTDDAANEFVTFTPTSVTGLPAKLENGKEFTATIAGNLTISGVTKPQTFTVKGTFTGSKITAAVETKLKRSDYKLTIPNIPFVANVSDSFTVSGTLVADLVK